MKVNMEIQKRIKICMITSGHSRYDVRIFHKECKSLLKKGYEVTLIVNDEFDDELRDGINIISTKYRPKNRFERIFLSKKRIKEVADSVNADIYHLHDSELLQMVKYFKNKKKIVIFDSHEDYLYAIDDKKWIPNCLKKTVGILYKIYERSIISKVDAAIVCYHWTEERFSDYCKNVKMVLNFPIIKENENLPNVDFFNRSIGFAGQISEMWCHKEVIKACSQIDDVRYELAGKLNGSYGEELKLLNGWKMVNYHGVLPSNEVYEKVYANSSIGIALLDYISLCKGNIGNLSNTKIFEIMYAGLPLLCTDFLLWKEIIDNEKCGIYVNPHNGDEVISAIKLLLSNPEMSKEMGENGKKAVIEKYNWNECEKELYNIYDYLLQIGEI